MNGIRHRDEQLIVRGNREDDFVESLVGHSGEGMIGNGMTDGLAEYDAGAIRRM